MSHEITISWDRSPTPGASYNIFRGTAPGNEAATPYATNVLDAPLLALSSVTASVSGNAVYTGTITGGDSNAFIGLTFTVTGFLNAGNNGRFVCMASTATSLTLANTGATAESASANARSRPYFIDNAVIPGHIYSYEITAVVGGVSSADSVEIISPPVPFDPVPDAVDVALASSFEILAGSTITNTGATIVGGDVGVSPGTSITGFGPPALFSGVLHMNDFVAAAAQSALHTAYTDAQGRTGAVTLAADIGGTTLRPGVYNAASSLAITGTLVLDAQGNPDAVWIIQIGSTLTTAVNNSDVLLLNGAQAQNVYWAVGSSATLNGGTNFVGTIMAQASITVGTGVNVNGRLLAMTGAVTLDTDTVQMFLAAALAVYASNTFFRLGTIIYDCATNSYQQVSVAGTTGATRPTFSDVAGVLTQDGSVTWVSLDPPLVTVTTGLPPSPPNTPPAPPAAPTNPSVVSED
jgi:hypothetical protein